MDVQVIHIVPNYEDGHIVDLVEQCWCGTQYCIIESGMMVVHADLISRTLGCQPAFHGTAVYPITMPVNEGPVYMGR